MARDFVGRIRAQTAMFQRDQAAAKALREALVGVARTYEAVNEAVEQFLAPLVKGSAITPARYRPLATGQLTAEVEAKRGHCTRIGEAYIAEGGLRDALPEQTDDDVVSQLDRIFLELSNADHDLFAAMVAVGEGLAEEAAALVNMLLAGQKPAARARLERSERRLAPLIRDLNRGRAELNRLGGELGLTMTNK